MDAYTAALLRHLEEVAPRAAGMQVDTVYFGGGTPSYLGASRLARLLQAVQRRYNVVRDAEITLEANPDSAGDWKHCAPCGGPGSTVCRWGCSPPMTRCCGASAGSTPMSRCSRR